MADIDDHSEFDLDTALSADLDGTLDDYAAELGVPADAMRTRLDTSEARARHAELASARDALASAPAGLDEVTRRRLLDGAGTRSGGTESATRDRSWLYRVGAAAAVVLVVLGGVVLIDRGSDAGDSAKSSDASASGGSGRSGVPATGDLGDVGSLDQAEIEGLLGQEGTNALKGVAPSAPKADTGADAAVPGFVAGADTQAVDACAAQYTSQGTIRFRGSGTFQGRAAVVLGIDSGGRTIVFVVAAEDCNQVLYSASR